MTSVLQLLLCRPPLAWLEITVEEARGLSKGGAFSKTNTYCVIQSAGDAHRTPSRKNTSTPSWKEKLTFRIMDLSHHALLKIYVFNKGMREDSLIGLVEVRLQKLLDQQPKEEWLPLFPSTNNLNSTIKQVGEVHVFMQLILTSLAKEVKLKKKPVFLLETMVNNLTANGELAGKEALQSSDGSSTPRVSVESQGKEVDTVETCASLPELILLNELGGIACTSIPIRMNTCDIVLFSSKHALSYATKLLTHSKWDHVGLVINFKGALTLLESTYGSGVQINHLDDRLKNFMERGTRVGVRRLQTVLTAEQKEALLYFIHEMLGRPYEKNLLELARAIGSSDRQPPRTAGKENSGSKKEQDLSSVFCSSLVAAALQKIGVVSPNTPSNEFSPADFAATLDNRLVKCTYLPVQIFGRRISSFDGGSR